MNSISRIVLFVAAMLWATPSPAQFSDQATWGGTAGGTANALAIAVPNWSRNLPGVVIRFLPSADNTGASTAVINGFGTPLAIQKPGNNGLAALSGGELRSGQMAMLSYDGVRFVLLNQIGQFVRASDLSSSALSFGFAVNLQIVASVNTNALTIAVKTGASGATSPADPTPTTPVIVPFRNNTIASGDPKPVLITAALGLTISSGNTMGCVSGQPCRLWVAAICSSGLSCTNSAGSDVVGLCAFNALSGTSVAPMNEAALQTSAGGTNGGSSAQTYYCNISSVTSRAIRVLGYVEITEAIAGTWATGPTITQMLGPGVKRPGDIVQVVAPPPSTTNGTTSSTTFVTITTGPSASITPTSSANVVRVSINASLNLNTTSSTGYVQTQRGSTLIGLPIYTTVSSSINTVPAQIVAYDLPNVTTSTTYSYQGKVSTGVLTFPVASGGSGSTMEIWEIMSAIPINDNDPTSLHLAA